jgi:4-cresol dehydrogenase (hydroxylating)
LGKVVFVNDAKLALGETVARCLNAVGLGKRLRTQLQALKHNYGLLKGVPTDEPLLGAQWRLRHPPEAGPANPLDAGCGLMWTSPVLPMTGRDATAVLHIAEPIMAQYGFDLLATFTFINERAMIAILNVAFDKADADETTRARRCYDALVDALIAGGYIPYRVGLHGMPKLHQEDDTFWEVATQIKRALDPKDIIARGRYIPLLTPDERE